MKGPDELTAADKEHLQDLLLKQWSVYHKEGQPSDAYAKRWYAAIFEGWTSDRPPKEEPKIPVDKLRGSSVCPGRLLVCQQLTPTLLSL